VALTSWTGDRRLDGNQLTGTIPTGITGAAPHRYLYNNQLTGMIPPSTGELRNLTVLYVSLRDFGAICVRVCAADMAAHRSLYKNQLTGTIPSNIGLLSALSVLYVSPWCRPVLFGAHIMSLASHYPQPTDICSTIN
jgi:hypothetical protein